MDCPKCETEFTRRQMLDLIYKQKGKHIQRCSKCGFEMKITTRVIKDAKTD